MGLNKFGENHFYHSGLQKIFPEYPLCMPNHLKTNVQKIGSVLGKIAKAKVIIVEILNLSFHKTNTDILQSF